MVCPVPGAEGPRLYRTVTCRDLKEMMAKRWRRREGTLVTADTGTTTDPEAHRLHRAR